MTKSQQKEYDELSDRLRELESEDYLKKLGLSKIENDPDTNVEIASTINDVDMPKPTMYYDNDMQMYVMTGYWNWNKTYPDSTVGGTDGFALGVAQEQISVFEHGLRTSKKDGTSSTPSVQSPYVNGYGIGFEFQDSGLGLNYNCYKGTGWVYFRFYNGTPVGKTINFNSKYGHSWSSTEVTGFSIGPTDLGISWNYSTNKFEDSNYGTKTF
ncbi:hypothetical protein [Bacillus litorisediminis]|uniref:hypothetical protein n=1 Tax=Bacillus litorisediminis TaxID=2922713 RepID=UPI001FACAF21|nr:hypothetical protein [Bacillus litorisediminis]